MQKNEMFFLTTTEKCQGKMCLHDVFQSTKEYITPMLYKVMQGQKIWIFYEVTVMLIVKHKEKCIKNGENIDLL